MTGGGVLGGRYELVEVLGTGGMATVWRGRDQVLGREVAVKVLSQHYAADPGFLARFEREARHAASVSNPRLVTVFDSGVDRGMPFLVMELVSGQTLRQVLDEAGMLPPGQAVGIAAAVCEGLGAAHAAGLVHRDIKPANIMLAGPDVKILDFGIARADGTRAGTAAGTVLGTAAYLSPEQAAGGPAGPGSDLYSLGCVLFEMLTGTPPFGGETMVALAYRQVHDDPGPPSARRPGLPPVLDQITAWLLAKDPAARPASATAARAALLDALTPGSTAAPGSTAVLPTALAQEAGRGWRPRPAEIVLGTALAAVLIALVAVLLTGQHSTGPGPTAGGRTGAAAATSQVPLGAGASTAVTTTNAGALPPVAAAAADLVGELQAGVTDGQVTQQAGRDLFNQLQQVLFAPPGQDPGQTQNQFDQFVSAYDQRLSQGDITGTAATTLRTAITALGTALGVI